jgi:hypothetical protein
VRRGLLALACALAVLLAPASAALGAATRNASQLATAIVADASTLTGASFVTIPSGGNPASVSQSYGPLSPVAGDTFAGISSGAAPHFSEPGGPSGSTYSNDNGDTGTRGANDVTILQFGLQAPATANCLGFSFYYLSEDFGSGFGDNALDGFIAELDPTAPWSVSGAETTSPANFAFYRRPSDGAVLNPISADPDFDMEWGGSANNAAGTQYGGGTGWLHAQRAVSPGAHGLELSIFDRLDNILDSTVLLDGASFVRRVSGGCPTGTQKGIGDFAAPSVTLSDPATGAVTQDGRPVLRGEPGTAAGDPATVEARIFSGQGTGGNVARQLTAGVSGSSWQVTTEPALPPGTYTAQARQVDDSGNEGLSAPRTFTVPSPAGGPPPGGATPARRCRVPRLKGKRLRAVRRALRRANCRPGRVRRKRAKGRPGRVIAQRPRPGARRPAGSRVSVTVSRRR